MPRPSASKKYPNILPLFFKLEENHKIVYSYVTQQGYPRTWHYNLIGQEVTVIIGLKVETDKKTIFINTLDEVYTCLVGNLGKISSVGKHNAGKEITIIYNEQENGG
jgi:hypothetical protein